VSAKAGWYPDPSGHQRSRYWDGDRWTARVDEFHAQDPLPEGATFDPPPEDPQRILRSESVRRQETEPVVDRDPTSARPPLTPLQRQMQREDRNRKVMIGCGLAVLWVVGGAITIAVSMANTLGAQWQCGDAGRFCDDHTGEAVLRVGFGIIILITVITVIAYRRSRRGEHV
jgi:hypothetical protein